MAFLIGGAFGFIIMSALLDAMPWRLIWKVFYFPIHWTIIGIGYLIGCVIGGIIFIPLYVINKFKKEPPKEV